MNKKLYFLILTVIFYGCTSINSDINRFIRYRDYDVGRSVELSYQTPIDVFPYTQTQDKYLYMGEGDCRWIYFVNKETKIVESWQYVSAPEKCSMKVDWGGIW